MEPPPDALARRAANSRAYRRRCPIKAQANRIKHKYGLTPADYEALLKAQQNQCAICGVEFKSWPKDATAHIDHDHVSGRVRGLLCSKHNMAMGLFGDDPAMLQRAARYLSKK